MEKIQDKYANKREENLDADELRKTKHAESFKTGILKALDEQAAAKRRELVAEKIRQDNLDKAQITAAVERDDRLNEAQRQKDIERRKLGRQWMIEAERQYQKSIEQA